MAERRAALTTEQLAEGVIRGERAILARAITLIESTRADHRLAAAQLLTALMPRTGRAVRVGITGVPGVGKSTFIDALGTMLTAAGMRVAVLAVDPSSERTGGSILGDKTLMARLSVDPLAYVRPSPASGTLGGVAAKTREAMLVCEAAGFDVVLVETVGVGQSETVVARMTDTFLALMLPGAGDRLQGIKRGLMELADIVAVNKADGDRMTAARRAASEYRGALRLLHPSDADWQPPVLTCSATEETGLAEVWDAVARHRAAQAASGALDAKRRDQRLRWMWTLIEDRLRSSFRDDGAVKAALVGVEAAVEAGEMSPPDAAQVLLRAFRAE